jgi:hypothetical protein
MNMKWSEAEKAFIRQNAGKMTDAKLTEELKKMSQRGAELKVGSVRKMRQRLGIKKESGRGRCKVVDPALYRPKGKKKD